MIISRIGRCRRRRPVVAVVDQRQAPAALHGRPKLATHQPISVLFAVT